MNKTKIDWCDSTWNPVTGCLHGCEYCYARKIAARFGGASETHHNETVGSQCQWETEETGKVHDLIEPIYDVDRGQKAPYPYYFDPTFHRYRLDDYANKQGKNIFVCSMADLFGEWVPDEWIDEIIARCKGTKQHNYLFLTKNPHRYMRIIKYSFQSYKSLWFGASATNYPELYTNASILACHHLDSKSNTFISIEPILKEIDPIPYQYVRHIQWVIIGAETGNRKDKVIPKRKWIQTLVDCFKAAEVPVFMKESLREIMGDEFIQEYPESLKPKNKQRTEAE
ncbi:MAG: DUF5131 family protein [Selenomonadaceae bacterium]